METQWSTSTSAHTRHVGQHLKDFTNPPANVQLVLSAEQSSRKRQRWKGNKDVPSGLNFERSFYSSAHQQYRWRKLLSYCSYFCSCCLGFLSDHWTLSHLNRCVCMCWRGWSNSKALKTFCIKEQQLLRFWSTYIYLWRLPRPISPAVSGHEHFNNLMCVLDQRHNVGIGNRSPDKNATRVTGNGTHCCIGVWAKWRSFNQTKRIQCQAMKHANHTISILCLL